MLIFVIVIRFYIYLILYLTLRYQIYTILRFEVVIRQLIISLSYHQHD